MTLSKFQLGAHRPPESDDRGRPLPGRWPAGLGKRSGVSRHETATSTILTPCILIHAHMIARRRQAMPLVWWAVWISLT